LLALLTAAEGLIMIGYAAADLALASSQADTEWGAVWFVVVGLGLWGMGLLLVARGLLKCRRWAFTPVVFTQLMFGILAFSFFGEAATLARVGWGGVLVLATITLRLVFSRSVRDTLITPNTG
jgi:hypothetical protein